MTRRRKEKVPIPPNNQMSLTTKLRLETELAEIEKLLETAGVDIGEVGGTSDWHDNPALEAARENFYEIIKKKFRLRIMISQSEIIPPQSKIDQIRIGNTVIVQFEGYQPEKFTILSDQDAFTDESWISSSSPLGQALLNKQTEDDVEFSVRYEGRDIVNSLQVLKILPGEFK